MRKKILFVMVAMLLASMTLVAGDSDGSEEKITFDGEMRMRNESRMNYTPAFPADDSYDFTLMRSRFGVKAQVNDNIRVYFQVQDSRILGTETGLTSNSKNLDLHQGYFVWQNINDMDLSLTVGRQEMSFGDQRLVSSAGWNNVGRAFDGVRLTHNTDTVTLDAFYTHVDETMVLDKDCSFSGVYSRFKSLPVGNIDLYGLRKADPGVADLNLLTWGVRLDGSKVAAVPFGYKAEAIYQNGNTAGRDVAAYAYHAEASYKLNNAKLLVEYNCASGDDNPADSTVRTFDQLYAGNHGKYGHIDFIGLRNMRELGASVKRSMAGHTFTLAYHKFWRAQALDSVYRSSGKVLLPAMVGVDSNDIGQEIDFTWSTKLDKGLGLLAGVAYFDGGEIFTDSYGDFDNAGWAFVQTTVKF